VGLQIFLALLGGRVELAVTLSRRHSRQAFFFEQRQRGVHHAGAGRIGAGKPLFDGLDDLVAVARLVGNQLQDHQPQMARVEQPLAHAAEAALKSSPAAAKTAVKMTASVLRALILFLHFFPMSKHVFLSDLSKIYLKIYRNTFGVKDDASGSLGKLLSHLC